MKTLTFITVFTISIFGISGYLIKVRPPQAVIPKVPAPVGWVHLQRLILPLFENVCEVSTHPTIRRLAPEFNLDAEDYTNLQAVTNLRDLVSSGLLTKGEIFSEYNLDHMNELKIIYELLFSAKNFDVFYKTAAWARQNVNCGLYVNAIYLAMLNRKDMEKLAIPAPYELLPNYFVGTDVIIKASSILAGEEFIPSESIREEGNGYTIDANYTENFYDNDGDSKLAYFREDIGLNSYYLLRKLKLAPWLNEDINSRYGENMYQMMKQFTARYNLERYANGLPEIDSVDWNSLSEIPYESKLIYSDGNEFAYRSSQIDLLNNENLKLLQTIEDNIVMVASHMREKGYNKTQILNHLMEILVTGDRSYETLARQLLGKDLSNNGHPSVLEHYVTSLRDPMFWKINKKIVDMMDSALNLLTPYSKNELFFPGVEILNIDVKKAMTVYEYFEFEVTDALKIDNTNSTFNVKIGQPRLNHKPFTVKLNISSLVASKGVVKIYLGPKLMPAELVDKKNLFTLYDQFEINLKKGINIISRTSDEIKYYAPDFMSLSTIRKKVEDAEFGLDSLPLKTIEAQVGYPLRLTLPKGTPQGLPLQIFAFVAPYYKANVGELHSTNSMELNNAILSPGYPLDLAIEDKLVFTVPNSIIKYITVTHKGDNKVENYGTSGVTKKWSSGNNYDPASRPSYSGNNGNSFDYQSKKGQYGQKDYSETQNKDLNIGRQDLSSSEENQDHGYFGDVPRLLLSKSFDYTSKSKKKEPFDYQTKKTKFAKKDYTSKKGDYIQYRMKSTTEHTSSIKDTESIENDDYISIPLGEESVESDKNISNAENIDLQTNQIDHEYDGNDNSNDDHTSPVIITKRTPTIYDFLIHGFDFDYNADRLYE